MILIIINISSSSSYVDPKEIPHGLQRIHRLSQSPPGRTPDFFRPFSGFPPLASHPQTGAGSAPGTGHHTQAPCPQPLTDRRNRMPSPPAAMAKPTIPHKAAAPQSAPPTSRLSRASRSRVMRRIRAVSPQDQATGQGDEKDSAPFHCRRSDGLNLAAMRRPGSDAHPSKSCPVLD